MKRLFPTLALLLVLAPGGAPAEPGLQPGLLESLCVTRVPPDPNCVSIAYPLVDVWSVGAILPVREDAEAAYDALIPAPFTPPPSGRREIAVLMFRLELPMSPTSSIETDPGEGYSEGSVAIRVGFPAAAGFPYAEGWWDLAQPLNDPAQYGAGRGVGLPKYMANAAVRRLGSGDWVASATDWGEAADQSGGPGSQALPGGNVLQIGWTAADPGVSAERAEQLWRWGQYGEPLFVERRPYDEAGAHQPAMVKFTPTSLVPLYDVPRTPVTEYPDPIVGTANVRLEGTIPGPGGAVGTTLFSTIVDPGVHVVAGTLGFVRGYAFLTIDNLANNQT